MSTVSAAGTRSSHSANGPSRNACSGGEVALERERDVAGDQQQIALGDLRQVLVDVGGADDAGHCGLRD
jgi:hypothetical protein